MDVLASLLMVSPALATMMAFVTMCCCSTGCTHCSATPTQMQVTITNVTNGTCTSCSSINATVTASYLLTGCYNEGTNACLWTTQLITTGGHCTCGFDLGKCYNVTMGVSGSDYVLTVGACCRITGGCAGASPGDVAWRENFGTSTPDCTAFSAQSVTYLSSTANCNGAASLCSVTSL